MAVVTINQLSPTSNALDYFELSIRGGERTGVTTTNLNERRRLYYYDNLTRRKHG